MDPAPRSSRLLAAYFPDEGQGDPNRADAGPVRVDNVAAVVAVVVSRLLIPSNARLVVRLVAAAVRVAPAAPVLGASYVYELAVHRDGVNPPIIDAVVPTLSNQDGAYTLAQAIGADSIDLTFAGLIGEAYDVVSSWKVFAARQR